MTSTGVTKRAVPAYLAACLAAATALWALPALIGLGSAITSPPGAGNDIGSMVLLFLVAFGITLVVTLLSAALPALVLVALTERYRVRALWVHALAAAVVGVLIYVIWLQALSWTRGVPPEPISALIFAVLGAIAGSVYWFIAVRGRKD